MKFLKKKIEYMKYIMDKVFYNKNFQKLLSKHI